MSLRRPPQTRFWPAALRWSAAALVIAGAHGTVGWMVANWQRAEAAAGAPPAAVMIELAPLAVAPETPQQDIAPGPEMVESEPEPPPPEPVVEKPPEPEPPPPEPEPEPEPEIKIPELPPLPDPAAVLSPPPRETPPPRPKEIKREPPKPKVVKRRKPVERDKPRAEQTSAPMAQQRVAPRVAAPSSGASSASPAATASWRGSLIAHLNRFKRFPSGASPGTVQVAFSIDRGGRVLSARLVRSSGESELDQEAVAMIRRASPVPAPPDGLGGSSISLAVPIRFSR